METFTGTNLSDNQIQTLLLNEFKINNQKAPEVN